MKIQYDDIHLTHSWEQIQMWKGKGKQIAYCENAPDLDDDYAFTRIINAAIYMVPSAENEKGRAFGTVYILETSIYFGSEPAAEFDVYDSIAETLVMYKSITELFER